jgi:hypothetical protein
MGQIFKIAASLKLGESQFCVLDDKSIVTEQLFWQLVTSKVKEITEKQPEKFDETLNVVKTQLENQSITIIDTWFEIKNVSTKRHNKKT